MITTPTQANIQVALKNFLGAVLPADVEVVTGQANRVPEPDSDRFVIMTPRAFERIETNVDSVADANFTGSISGTTMTITAIDAKFPNGKISPGSTIFGVGLAANTVVSEVLSGTGQVGTYKVAPSQNISSETLSAGTMTLQQALKCTVQLDFHSADFSAGDLANTVSTLFRDAFAVSQFANQSPNYGVVPLYADDARQLPFINDQRQVEWRWVVDALLQANVVVSVPMQFADAVGLGLISVDEAYPP